MFPSLVSLLAGSIAGFFATKSKPFRVAEDLEALFARMRQRLYPEMLPVLAYQRRSRRVAVVASSGRS
jgi:hypothetical protein